MTQCIYVPKIKIAEKVRTPGQDFCKYRKLGNVMRRGSGLDALRDRINLNTLLHVLSGIF